jgi:alkyl hydroperoxide reductase subunit AhpF
MEGMNRTPIVLFLLVLFPAAAGAFDGPGKGQDLLAFFHGDRGGEKTVLSAKERSLARQELGGLEGKAGLVLFILEKECETCREARRFVEEMAALSPSLSCEILSLSAGDGRASELGIDKAPGIAVLGAADTGIRYYGVPLGYEFGDFVKAVRQTMVSKPDLAPETLLGLSRLDRPVTLTVFIVDT